MQLNELSGKVFSILSNENFAFNIDFSKYKGSTFDFTSSGTGIYLFNEKTKNVLENIKELVDKNGFVICIDKFTIVPIPSKTH